jgi:hypothetical protein
MMLLDSLVVKRYFLAVLIVGLIGVIVCPLMTKVNGTK